MSGTEQKIVKRKQSGIFGNGVSLMVFQVAKIVFPLITLPYLTRILSVEVYGVVTYVKAVMNYMQIFVDFGFVLSGTKDVVQVRDNQNKLELVVGDTMAARTLLGLVGFVIVAILAFSLPILRDNMLFTLLSYITVFLSVFLFDFLFRGMEVMYVIAVRFVVMKIISTVLTFILVKNDSDVILIPILDIISSLIAVALVLYEVKKLQIKMKFSNFKNIVQKIKESFVYFLSNAAATSLNAISTIIIGIYANAAEVAYWGLAMQIIGTITALYNPISDSLYPEMIKTKKFGLMRKALMIFVPLVIFGSALVFLMADFIFKVMGGEEYLNATPAFRVLVLMLTPGFLSVMFGWPVLGSIDKMKKVTTSTIISVTFNIVVLLLLAISNNLTLINMAIARVATEVLLIVIRYYWFRKYRNLFVDCKRRAVTR